MGDLEGGAVSYERGTSVEQIQAPKPFTPNQVNLADARARKGRQVQVLEP